MEAKLLNVYIRIQKEPLNNFVIINFTYQRNPKNLI